MSFFRHLGCIFVLTLPLTVVSLSQDNLRDELFGEVNQKLSKANEKKAEFYAPTSFEKGMKYYEAALDDFSHGRKPEDIREKVKNAEAYFAKALDACHLGADAFSATMAARTDASSADAPKSFPNLWSQAEEKFKRAARMLEDGNNDRARQSGAEATALYRSAELEAIKSNFLSPARDLVKTAHDLRVEDRAPKSLARAEKLIANVESLLNENRYDSDSARQLAQEAKYEASHALYLSQSIGVLQRDDKSLEDVILADEEYVQRIAGSVGARARFDNGFEGAVGQIVSGIGEERKRESALEENLRHAGDSLRAAGLTLREKDNRIENLKLQVASMENRLGSLTENERNLKHEGEELQHKLDAQRLQEEKIRNLSTLFTEDEAIVLRDGDNIIIRLIGLTFPVGKNTIEPQYYSLLTKVQGIIKRFPQCQVAIEGHTDSQGSDELNQTLSESRAKAVAEYLMANMGVELPIRSEGYGESRPVASNDTPDGRAKNRRIDVVITPSTAGMK